MAQSESRRMIRRVMTWAASALRKTGSGQSLEGRSKGGPEVTARGLELDVGRRFSDRWTAKGESPRVIRHVTTCAVSAWRNNGPGRSLQGRSKGGSKATARGLDLVVGRWSSDRWTAKGEGQRVIRHATTPAASASRQTGPGPSLEGRSKGGSKATARGSELAVGRWSPDRWTAEGEGPRVIRHGTTRAVSPHGTTSRVGHRSTAPKVVRWRQPVGWSSLSGGCLRTSGRLGAKASGSSDT